jgi:sulfatase maturation enzyme AslB (radical SAM superfamily)
MLAYLRHKFLALKINTNAWYLDEKKAHAILDTEPNTLVFSADAADPELYAKLRVNGTLDRVMKNVRRFAEIKAKHYPDSRTITRVSGVRYSEEQNFDELEKFWHDFVDQVAFVDYNPWENAYELPANGKTEPCSDLWRRAFVWWDGRVNPCDVDYKSALSPGVVGKQSVSELWRGEGYGKLRSEHLNDGRQGVTPCRSCVVV